MCRQPAAPATHEQPAIAPFTSANSTQLQEPQLPPPTTAKSYVWTQPCVPQASSGWSSRFLIGREWWGRSITRLIPLSFHFLALVYLCFVMRPYVLLCIFVFPPCSLQLCMVFKELCHFKRKRWHWNHDPHLACWFEKSATNHSAVVWDFKGNDALD